MRAQMHSQRHSHGIRTNKTMRSTSLALGITSVAAVGRQHSRRLVCHASEDKPEPRPVGCPELYDMTQTINSMDSQSSSSSSSSSSSVTPNTATSPSASAAASAMMSKTQPQARGAEYYQGLVTTGIAETNGASDADMLKRNLQLAGGVAGFLVAMVVAFLASNGLL